MSGASSPDEEASRSAGHIDDVAGPSGAAPLQGRLVLEGIEKWFGSVRANDGVDLELTPGEIHGLLGENGAGKSTLVKILSGIYQPDGGTISIDNSPVSISSPAEARKLGVAVVHQQSMLVPRLTVLENVELVEGGLGRINVGLRKRLRQTAESLGFDLDPDARVEDLSVGQRQRAEIARALMHEARIVLLDEPTVVLAPMEQDDLFALLRRISAAGAGVVLVTHRLEEVRAHCDRVTVLRGGKVVGQSSTPGQLSQREFVRMLVGEIGHYEREPRPLGDVVLEVRGLAGSPEGDGRTLKGIDLAVRAGEVIGVAGVEGNGQRELAAALVGSWRPSQGSVQLDGRDVAAYKASDRASMIADIPDDEHLCIVHEKSIWENIALTSFSWSLPPTPRARARQKELAEQLMEEFGIRAASIETRLSQLSGGNRRRVVLAREFRKSPKLIVASYATKGLDVRSIEQVKTWIGRLAGEGAAVIYVAAELEELLAISDRIVVLARGGITGSVDVNDADPDQIGEWMLADVSAEVGAAG